MMKFLSKAAAFICTAAVAFTMAITAGAQDVSHKSGGYYPTGGLPKGSYNYITPEEAREIDEHVRADYARAEETDSAETPVASKYDHTTKYYYNQLNAKEKEFYNALDIACKKFMNSSVTLTPEKSGVFYFTEGIPFDDSFFNDRSFYNVYCTFYYSNPQYYFLTNGYNLTWYETRRGEPYGGMLYPNVIEGFADPALRNKYQTTINAVTDEWMNEINAVSGSLKKEEVVYTKLAQTVKYKMTPDGYADYDGNSQTIAGSLVDKTCVCNGYAFTVAYFLNAVGIDTIMAIGNDHAWNLVKLYGNWYELDVTWADQEESGINYDWINKSHATIMENEMAMGPVSDLGWAHEYDQSPYGRLEYPKATRDTVDTSGGDDPGGDDPDDDIKVSSLSFFEEPVTSYLLGDEIDLSVGSILVKYSDGTEDIITLGDNDVKIKGFDTSKGGSCTVTVEYGGKSITFKITVTIDPEKAPVRVGDNGFLTIADAVSFISKEYKNSDIDGCEIKVKEGHTEKKAISIPSGCPIITLVAPSLTLSSPKITVSSDFIINADITCASALSFNVKKNVKLGLASVGSTGGMILKGANTSGLYTACDISASKINGFSYVETYDSKLSVSGSANIKGCFVGELYAASGVTLADAGDMILSYPSAAASKVNISKMSGALSIKITDKAELESSSVLFNYKGSDADYDRTKITLLNTGAGGEKLEIYRYGKTVKAELPGALMLYTMTGSTLSETPALYPNFEALVSDLKAGVDYTVKLAGDMILTSALSFSDSLGSLTIDGDGHTLGLKSASLSLKCAFGLKNIRLVSDDKFVSLKTSKALTLTNATTGAVKTGTSELIIKDSRVNGKVTAKGNITADNSVIGGALKTAKGLLTISNTVHIDGKVTAAQLKGGENAVLGLLDRALVIVKKEGFAAGTGKIKVAYFQKTGSGYAFVKKSGTVNVSKSYKDNPSNPYNGYFVLCTDESLNVTVPVSFNDKKALTADADGKGSEESAETIRDISSVQLIKEIKIGWNLGNTLEATDGSGLNSETSWGCPKTTADMISAVKTEGFNIIRVPVTWYNHMDEDGNIDTAWMNRVKEVVDYIIDDKTFVILDVHHENWNYTFADNKDSAVAMTKKVWTQIAGVFRNYDEHLIFEGQNEPRMVGSEDEWTTPAAGSAAYDVINAVNKAFIETVRASGGNNAKRHLMIPSYAAQCNDLAAQSLYIPDDDKVIVSVHAYIPFDFALSEEGTKTFSADDPSDTGAITYHVNTLKKYYLDKGIPVIIGEVGAMDKDNPESRIEWAKYITAELKNIGVPFLLWDNYAFTSGETFGLLDRKTLNWEYPGLMETFMEAYR